MTHPPYHRYFLSRGFGLEIFHTEIPVLRRTPRGVWVQPHNGAREKFILDTGTGAQRYPRYAYPTREDAWAHLWARLRKRAAYLQRDLLAALYALEHMPKTVPEPEAGHTYEYESRVLKLLTMRDRLTCDQIKPRNVPDAYFFDIS